MKKVIALLLVFVMTLGLIACGGSGDGQDKVDQGNKTDSGATQPNAEKVFDSLHVGVARGDITPPDPIGAHINGGGDPNRLAETILDELTITCIAITDKENKTVLFYSQDIHNPVAATFTDETRQAISKTTGVPFESIYMTATHTHSSLHPRDTTNEKNLAFNEKYNKAVLDVAVAALEDRAPATMYCSEVDVKEANNGQAMAFVRHYTHKDGSVAGSNFGTYKMAMMNGFPYEADNGAQLVKFVREGKNPVLLMNWGAHSTFYGTTALKNISADYPAYLRQYIEENTDYTFAICLSGAGDQTPRANLYPAADHGMDCEDYGAALGKIIADYTAVDANFTKVEDGAIKQQHQVITVNTNKIPEEQRELAAKAQDVYDYFLEAGQQKGTEYAQANGFQSCYEARSFVARLKLDAVDTMEIPIDVMTLGNMAFVIASWEMSGHDSARVIKDAIKESGLYDMAFIMAYCNNNLGYIPATSNYEYNGGRGSYEAYDCNYAKGTCEQLAQAYIDLLGELKNS